MNVHVIVPELFPDPERGDTRPAETRAGALETLFARGRRKAGPGAGLEAWLLGAFAVAAQGELPAAPYSLIADGGDAHGAWWLRADPIHLRAERDTVLVSDATLFDIAQDEAEALAASLNRHFAASGMTLAALRPERWYARLELDPAMTAWPLADVRGRPLGDLMPSGPQGRHWRAVLNEIQMCLHDHPVNQAREARGALVLNGVWLWGAGRLTEPPTTAYQRVVADDPLARGLALAAGRRHDPLPDSAREWLASGDRSGIEAIVLDALRVPAAYGDMAAWQARLAALERDWFAPLLSALRAGRIGMLTLHSPNATRTHSAETTRQDLRYFWRRRRPLEAYAA